MEDVARDRRDLLAVDRIGQDDIRLGRRDAGDHVTAVHLADRELTCRIVDIADDGVIGDIVLLIAAEVSDRGGADFGSIYHQSGIIAEGIALILTDHVAIPVEDLRDEARADRLDRRVLEANHLQSGVAAEGTRTDRRDGIGDRDRFDLGIILSALLDGIKGLCVDRDHFISVNV